MNDPGASLGNSGSPSESGAAGSLLTSPGGSAGSAGSTSDAFEPGDDPKSFLGRGPGQIFETTIEPLPGEKFVKAVYRIYVPDSELALRGIIIRQHGCGRNGIDMPHDLQWQVLANKWVFGLLGTFYDDGGNCGNWANLDSGSVEAMQRGLAEFATQAARSELTQVPWAIWGHSGGGNWAYAVARDYPERVIAVVPRSGAGGELPEASRRVPLLLSAGQLEQDHAQFGRAYESTVTAFERERAAGGLVALSIDPEATHEIRQGRLLAIPYLDAFIRRRMPRLASVIEPLDEASSWLGNVSSFEVSAYADYAGDKSSAALLPDETVARKWAEFSQTGTVVDATPPYAPFEVTAIRQAGGVQLSWRADADLDSGIKHFVVYRDGQMLALVGSPFQQGNFGDEPEPALPSMSAMDAAAPENPSYEISSVNFFDLESPRSIAVSP
jgi:pimeloyl-ACP methyl ester carboxylesterase